MARASLTSNMQLTWQSTLLPPMICAMTATGLRFIGAVLWLMLALFPLSTSSQAAQVATELAGIDITANLEIAPRKSLKRHGAVILVHDTLSHGRSEMMANLQQLLAVRGVNSLAITLSYGFDQRQGRLDCALEHDHRHGDAVDEIATWYAWLKAQKARKIFIAGHGRGANQAALFAVKLLQPTPKSHKKKRKKRRARKNRDFKGLILMSPMLGNANQARGNSLRSAAQMIKDGEGNQMLPETTFLNCQNALVTANAFENYYAQNPQNNTLNLLPSVLRPVLAIAGSLDPAASALSAELSLPAGAKHLSLSIVEGANASFDGFARETLADGIQNFISRK